MFQHLFSSTDSALFSNRRTIVRARIKEALPDVQKGILILSAGFESERAVFRQESSFYYLTGITEPGVVLIMEMTGKTTLFIPGGHQQRGAWMKGMIDHVRENPKQWGIDAVVDLGKALAGYQIHPFTPVEQYEQLIAFLSEKNAQGYTVLALNPTTAHQYIEQRYFLERVLQWVPGLKDRVHDISPLVAEMRKSKDTSEIDALYKAVQVTIACHEAVAHMIAPDINEAEVQATLEYMMIGAHARPAFASIVGSGINSTVLHYHENSQMMKKNELVVVDIGAELQYYSADITRTYPISGIFSPRQKELYNLVLATQEYVASVAKPGIYLSNKKYPEQSLHHMAQEFLKKQGYDKYFIHGIGHYLGLDVHDVGDYQQPLDNGDVFTIEPGIYIPEEKMGIRIEDDYWMIKDTVVCLSDNLPKKADDIEAMMRDRLTPEMLAAFAEDESNEAND